MPGFLLLAPLLDLERDRVCCRSEAGFRLQLYVAAVSRAGATAEIGGSSCRHGAEKLTLRVPLAVPATAATVCRGYACNTDAS
jgi:hypothetical protein